MPFRRRQTTQGDLDDAGLHVVRPIRADEVRPGDVLLRYMTNPARQKFGQRLVTKVADAPKSMAAGYDVPAKADLRFSFDDGGIVYYWADAEVLKVVSV